MKKLRIAQVAPLWFSIPPKKYGGVERIVSYLTEELVKRGHDVTLFASADSKTSAKLIPGWPKCLFEERLFGKPIKWGNCTFPLLNISQAFEMAENFDIIHVHENSNCLSNFFTRLVNTPVIITVHDPFPPYSIKDKYALFKKYKDNNYISISNSHRLLAKKMGLNFVATIYNGININDFKFREKKGKYLVWLGRSAPNKGAKEAILAAKEAKEELILAGRIDINSPIARKYFEKQIQPNLNQKIRYLGEISHSQKVKLLSNAKALLNTIQWEEPFGLVSIEAMACGTPVIIFDRGSAKEVVKDGKTGFVIKPFTKEKKVNIKGVVEAIKKVNQIDRRECRKWVEENFTIERMVDDYEMVFQRMVRNNKKT
jgi:glycosyltransferase involved in cell wall biosynthesis